MATRAILMSNSLSPASRRRGFTGRLVVLMLFVIGISLWTNLVYQNQKAIPRDLMTIFAAIMIALSAGIGSRFLFYWRNGFVRLVTAWSSLVIGLFVLGIVTNWKLGIGPIEFWRKTYDWMEIAQLGGGMVIALIGLNIWWRRPAFQSSARPAKHRRRAVPQKSSYEQPVARVPQIERPRLQTSESRKPPERKAVHLKVAKQARAIERSAPQAERVVIGRLTKSVRPKKRGKLFHRKPELQISVHEEHRCPYCLEDVKQKDPRGVKECSICHTLHHADCWDITGMCQIPHLNS